MSMSVQNGPTKEPWWKLLIKWTVIIYGVGAVLTFIISLVIFVSALTSISRGVDLAIFYAVLWPLFIILLFRVASDASLNHCILSRG